MDKLRFYLIDLAKLLGAICSIVFLFASFILIVNGNFNSYIVISCVIGFIFLIKTSHKIGKETALEEVARRNYENQNDQ